MDFWRQTDIISQDKLNRFPFILIGAGGIGSVAGLVLAKMGVKDLTVYDPDVVANHNLPNQTYRLTDVGRPKVDALADTCREFAGVEIKVRQEKFPVTTTPSGIVISGVDSMTARQEIWAGAVRLNPLLACYIEARMGAQEGRVYTVVPHNPDHIALYEASLYSSDDAVQLPCTARAICFNTFYLAGLIGSQVRKFVMDDDARPEIIFDLTSNVVLTPQIHP
jgi:molybdopterin/thiamine biosynthesis adenylyltransferase